MPFFQDTPVEHAYRLALKKFIARELTPHREEWEKKRAVTRDLWRKMGKLGFLCQ